MKSSIEWTESTWNPITGCTKVSPGCKNCYAERMAHRLKAMGVENYRNGFSLALHEHVLQYPLTWKKPQTIFVNSMSDLFHDHVPVEYIHRVFDIMRRADWHLFQVLTKRSERLQKMSPEIDWPENVWMGVSVENDQYLDRIDHLRETNAAVRFRYCEPLLSSLTRMNLHDIDWVIVGGESGPKARPMDPSWVRDIREQCLTQGVPFFFKQWGGVRKKKAGRVLDGHTYDGMPDHTSSLAVA